MGQEVRAGKAYVELTGDPASLNKAVDGAQVKLKAFVEGIGSFGAKLSAVSALVMAPVAAGAKVFASFEKEMASVATILDEPEEHMERFKKGIRDMSVATGKSTEDLSRALYKILEAGVAPEQALEVLGTSAKLAKVGLTDVTTAADTVTSVLNAFGKSADQAGDVSDFLIEVVRHGKVSFEDLSGGIGKLAKTARAGGLSLEEMGAFIDVMTSSGLRGKAAVTAMHDVLETLGNARGAEQAGKEADRLAERSQRAAAKANQAIAEAQAVAADMASESSAKREAALKKQQKAEEAVAESDAAYAAAAAADDAAGAAANMGERFGSAAIQGRGLHAVLAEIAELPKDQLEKVFGEKAVKLGPALQNIDKLGANITALQGRAGATQTALEKMKGVSSGQAFGRLEQSVTATFEVLGEANKELTASAIQRSLAALETTRKWIEGNKELVQAVVKAAWAVGIVGSALVTFSALVIGVSSFCGSLFALWSAGIGVVTGLWAAVTSPIGLVLGGIGALAAGFIAFAAKTTNAFIGMTFPLWYFNTVIRQVFGKASSIISALWRGDMKTVGDEFGSLCDLLPALWDSVASLLSSAWDGLKEVWEHKTEILGSLFDTAMGFVTSAGEKAWAALKDTWSQIEPYWNKAWTAVKEKVLSVLGPLLPLWKVGVAIWETLSGFIADAAFAAGVFFVAFKAAGTVIAAVSAISSVVGTIGTLFSIIASGPLTLMLGGLGAIGTAVSFLLSPVGLVTVGILALGDIFYSLVPAAQSSFGTLGKLFDDTSGSLGRVFKAASGLILSVFSGDTKNMEGWWKYFVSVVRWEWYEVTKSLKKAWSDLKADWKPHVDAMGTVWKGFTDGLKTAWEAIRVVVEGTYGTFETLLSPINALLNKTESWKKLWDSIYGTFGGSPELAKAGPNLEHRTAFEKETAADISRRARLDPNKTSAPSELTYSAPPSSQLELPDPIPADTAAMIRQVARQATTTATVLGVGGALNVSTSAPIAASSNTQLVEMLQKIYSEIANTNRKMDKVGVSFS